MSDTVVFSSLETENTARQLSRLTINLPENALLASPQATPCGYLRPSFKLSPDGSELVYVAEMADTTQLYRRRLAAFDVVPIPVVSAGFAGIDAKGLRKESNDGETHAAIWHRRFDWRRSQSNGRWRGTNARGGIEG